ncbi:unnamed protein product [Amoebophrya sp. A120]|nr:unnamed protein product [Amoebophrya sp. A120]|eukprot:GSA120T00022896001.1
MSMNGNCTFILIFTRPRPQTKSSAFAIIKFRSCVFAGQTQHFFCVSIRDLLPCVPPRPGPSPPWAIRDLLPCIRLLSDACVQCTKAADRFSRKRKTRATFACSAVLAFGICPAKSANRKKVELGFCMTNEGEGGLCTLIKTPGKRQPNLQDEEEEDCSWCTEYQHDTAQDRVLFPKIREEPGGETRRPATDPTPPQSQRRHHRQPGLRKSHPKSRLHVHRTESVSLRALPGHDVSGDHDQNGVFFGPTGHREGGDRFNQESIVLMSWNNRCQI